MSIKPTSKATAPGFEGFSSEAFAFLRELRDHNSKAWFDENRDRYKNALRQPLCQLVEALASQCEANGLDLTGDAKRSLFRINRDIRFSHNKLPYKEHISAALSRSGSRKDNSGILYLHIEPDNCFAACGFFQPAMKDLTAMREDMVEDSKTILSTVSALQQQGYELETRDRLKRFPRGFEATGDETLDDLLRLKSFIVVKPLAEKSFNRPKVLSQLLSFAQETSPLRAFGNAALDLRDANQI